MKAYRIREFGGAGSLGRDELPEPVPGPGEVLIRVRATSLNYRDLMIARGQYNPNLPRPLVPLSDGAGVVEGVGPGVTRFRVGDRVAGCFMPDWQAGAVEDRVAKTALGAGGVGMLAERVVLPEGGVVATPDHLTDEEAATLPCAAVTAWHALFDSGGLKAGDSVLIQGTGGVSLFALQLARAAGARVIATSGSDAKLGRVLALGASDGINYKTTPDWEKEGPRIDRQPGRRPRRRGRWGRHPAPLDQGRPLGRAHRADRRADRRRDRPPAAPDAEHPAPGNLRRLAGDVRGHEPRPRRQPDPSCDRPRLPLRPGPGSLRTPGKRRPLRQGRGLGLNRGVSKRTLPRSCKTDKIGPGPLLGGGGIGGLREGAVMVIHLSEESGRIVRSLMATGRYASEGEVIGEALRLLEQREEQAKLEDLRREIAIGIEQADRGELVPLDLDAALARVRARRIAPAGQH